VYCEGCQWWVCGCGVCCDGTWCGDYDVVLQVAAGVSRIIGA
jgi:hypothetical protein